MYKRIIALDSSKHTDEKIDKLLLKKLKKLSYSENNLLLRFITLAKQKINEENKGTLYRQRRD